MFGWRRPVVHLYAVCWNEAHILPYFFRNYEPWVQRFVIFDNGSTDGTQALLSAKPDVELGHFPGSIRTPSCGHSASFRTPVRGKAAAWRIGWW